MPRGLNLWTGWKLKLFGEYYQQPKTEEGDMQVVGLDLRHSLKIHRDLIWVTPSRRQQPPSEAAR
jgi:hypothetical protein